MCDKCNPKKKQIHCYDDWFNSSTISKKFLEYTLQMYKWQICLDRRLNFAVLNKHTF